MPKDRAAKRAHQAALSAQRLVKHRHGLGHHHTDAVLGRPYSRSVAVPRYPTTPDDVQLAASVRYWEVCHQVEEGEFSCSHARIIFWNDLPSVRSGSDSTTTGLPKAKAIPRSKRTP